MTNRDHDLLQAPAGANRPNERGSALIIATLVSVILSLLGISYMMMAQTENLIAENERNAAMALYAAEAGARLGVAWLNDPTSTGYLVPTTGQVDRTQRVFDHDSDSGTARVQGASGNAGQPIYKDSNFTTSTIFDRPYRSALSDTFLGVETGADAGFPTAGPDLVVGSAHLTTINDALFPNFPTPHLRARIVRLEFYAPPIVNGQRMGIATVKATGGVVIYPGTADERQVATRVVKAVVNEIPVPGPVGPLQSCADMSYGGSFEVHWGTASAQAAATIDIGAQKDVKLRTGVPYALNDPFTYWSDTTPLNLATWAANPAINGNPIDDPWFKFIAGGAIAGAGTTQPQLFPFAYPGDGTTSHSNIFQNTVISCPTFDYDLWKSIAQSGSKGHYYYKWSTGASYKLDGNGPDVTFANATGGKAGVFFFDTAYGNKPYGEYTESQGTDVNTQTNLTPAISISSASGWLGLQGFAYLNAKSFETTGAGSIGSLRTIFPPGEPFDASGWVNLDYPGSFDDNYVVRNGAAASESFVDPVTNTRYCTDCAAGQCTIGGCGSAAVVRDDVGLPFQETVVIDGVMYNSGTFTAVGQAKYFGSLVAQQGVIEGNGTPAFYFDESLIKGNWPRKGMNIPRVIITSWETEL
jgi:Tfp pilus assembly protein PilX